MGYIIFKRKEMAQEWYSNAKEVYNDAYKYTMQEEHQEEQIKVLNETNINQNTQKE